MEGYVSGYFLLCEGLNLHMVLVQVVTVNCARIIHGNQVATNGVVHVIDRVITAVGNTIRDIIEVDDELSTLSVSVEETWSCVVHEPNQLTRSCNMLHFFSRLWLLNPV